LQTSNGNLKSVARVFVVDDHPMIREGLAAVISTEPGLELCGDAEDVDDALERIEEAHPDLAIVDISLKTGNGIDLVKRLKAKAPDLLVLVWSMHAESLYAERALRAGARGYVNKGKSASDMLEAIHTVLDGRVYVSADTTERILGRPAGGTAEPCGPGVEKLTDRELEAFELLGQGLTTQQIAVRMRVSHKTVETFRARIKDKLGLTSSPELLQQAIQWAMRRTG
jgi:DNA-binding NarL/FixJ family response regulator